MPKKPYTGNYRKRAQPTGKGSAGLGQGVPPVTYDANQIASSNKSSEFMKKGRGNVHPKSRR